MTVNQGKRYENLVGDKVC